MLVAYLDESYTKDFYFIVAVIVSERDVPALESAISVTAIYAEGFGIPASTELHAHKIMSGTNGFESIRGMHRAAEAIYMRALTEIASIPVAVYICGVNVKRLNARYRYPTPPHPSRSAARA